MKSISRAAAAAIFALALASPCWAGQVKLEIRDGLVTLSAKDASIREVLAEWARVGQTRIINAERVPSGLLNLELRAVPEAKALDILLRSVAGYVAAPRPAGMVAMSRYDRILIMPVARPASGGAAPTPVATAPQPMDQRRMYQPQPSLMVDDQDEPVVQPQPQPQQPMPSATYPGASQPGMVTPAPNNAMPYGYPQGQQPGAYPPGMQPSATPGMAQPGVASPPGSQGSPAAPRPGMPTPNKPPGAPGGEPGGN